MSHKDIPVTAVIPAAGIAKNRIMMNSGLPDTMIPINGKPVIGYILEDLHQRGIRDIRVILNKADTQTEKYISKKFKAKSHIDVIYNDRMDLGLGHSVALGLKGTKEKVLVYLGDTIYKGKLSFDNDFLIASKSVSETSKWCFVEENKGSLTLIDKPKTYSGKGKALSGIYFFADAKLLKQSASKGKKIEMKDILEKYGKRRKFVILPAQKWYDCGNIENYYKAKIDFLKLRSFNAVHYDDLHGHITKKSKNAEKIKAEVEWYQNMPESLRIFSPRLIKHDLASKHASYSLEFYGYQSLADFFIFESLDIKLWHTIIDRLFAILKLFSKHKGDISEKDFFEIYHTKTLQRLDHLRKKPYWKKLLEKEVVVINGKEYKNVTAFLPHLKENVGKLYSKKDVSFIHGDPGLGNILFDPGSRIFKFIDPRGSFGRTNKVHGDQKYDVAKLRHSIAGYYDFIVSDLFEVSDNDGEFTLTIFSGEHNEEIARVFDEKLKKAGFDLKKIKFIEALLFLSMLPLHSDNKERQKAMYIRSIMLLNE